MRKPHKLFILYRSGSMGQWVGKLVNTVIPQLAQQYLGMSNDDKVTLITFDCHAEKVVASVGELEKMKMAARGSTQMSGVFDILRSSIDQNNPWINIVVSYLMVKFGILNSP